MIDSMQRRQAPAADVGRVATQMTDDLWVLRAAAAPSRNHVLTTLTRGLAGDDPATRQPWDPAPIPIAQRVRAAEDRARAAAAAPPAAEPEEPRPGPGPG